jgi:hypothetical protein
MIGFVDGDSKNSSLGAKVFFKRKGFMVKKNKRNNFFKKKDKIQGYTCELGLEIIQQPFPDNAAKMLVGIS